MSLALIGLSFVSFEGLFELDRIDRGRHTVFRPKDDLAGLFPVREGA